MNAYVIRPLALWAAALCLVAGSVAPAAAAPAATPGGEPAAGVSVPSTHSDEEILQLLFAGVGPIADQHPDIVESLGFAPGRPLPQEAELADFVDSFLRATPRFHETVAVPLTSGDPLLVERALKTVTAQLEEYVAAEAAQARPGPVQDPGMTGLGYWHTTTNIYLGSQIAAYAHIGAVANAAVYANVGLATFALATLGIVTWYLMDDPEEFNDVERGAFVADMTDALA